MRASVHNVTPDNDNRDVHFAEMQKQVAAMTTVVNELGKPGVIEAIVQEAVRPIAAELALQEKEGKARDGMRANQRPASGRFLLPKGD